MPSRGHCRPLESQQESQKVSTARAEIQSASASYRWFHCMESEANKKKIIPNNDGTCTIYGILKAVIFP